MVGNNIADTLKHYLETQIKVVGRRSSEKAAVLMTVSAINGLLPKYDFLKYVKIQRDIYTEDGELVTVNSEINSIKDEDLGRSIDEILDSVIKSLNENIGYFFIKEIEQDLDRKIGPIFQDFGISIFEKQQSYEYSLKEKGKIRIDEIRNSEVLIPIFNVLITLANQQKQNSITVEMITDALNKLGSKYRLLEHIKIQKTDDPEEFYEVQISTKIDEFISIERGEIIQEVLVEIGKSLEFENRFEFLKNLRYYLPLVQLTKIEKIGVNLNDIRNVIIKEEQDLLVRKIIEGIILVIEIRTSTTYIVELLDEILNKLRNKHVVLKYIKIDKNRSKEGMNAVIVMPEIRSEEPRIIAKAFKDVLMEIKEKTVDILPDFFESFERKIGKDNINEMGEIGINLYFLKLKKF